MAGVINREVAALGVAGFPKKSVYSEVRTPTPYKPQGLRTRMGRGGEVTRQKGNKKSTVSRRKSQSIVTGAKSEATHKDIMENGR